MRNNLQTRKYSSGSIRIVNCQLSLSLILYTLLKRNPSSVHNMFNPYCRIFQVLPFQATLAVQVLCPFEELPLQFHPLY